MPLRLDHIVIAVHDLDKAVADYGLLGFQVLRGGEHPGRGTHNALVVFEDGTYFELIAWQAPAPQERWWRVLQEQGEGIVDFALLPADTGATVRRAARAGLALGGPTPGGRRRPDGRALRWETARAATSDLPFLCGDITPRSLRVPRGPARKHANGARGVASLSLAVADLDATLERYRALLGVPDGDSAHAWVGEAFPVPDAGVRMALVELVGTSLVLTAPAGTRAPAELRQRLSGRGEGVQGVVLHVAGTEAPPPPSAALTHGARIEYEPAGLEEPAPPLASGGVRDGVGG